MIHGRNLIVSLDGVAIAGAKSCDIDIQQDFITACSPTYGRTMEKIPTTYDWGVSVGCLIPSSTLSVSLIDKLIAGTKCLLTFTDGSGQNRAGWVYVKDCKESGSVGSLATFSASFESTGPLYKCAFYNNGYWPQSGQGWELSIFNNDIRVDQSQTGGIYMVQVSPNKPGIVCIFTSALWAASAGNNTDELEEYLYYSETQDFENAIDAFKQGNGTLVANSQAQQWAICCNAKPTVLFLYE